VAIPAEQLAVASFLRGLAGADPVETHISLVYLGPHTAWKLKKAVRLSFLDFTAPARRRHFAERELALNGPHAPGLYRDVVAVIRRADGTIGFGDAADGEVLDWVLRMARVPAADFIDRIALRGGLTPALLDGLADAVADYHAALPPLPDARSDMAGVAASNARAAREAGLLPDQVAAWLRAITAMLSARAGWMHDRRASGFVRRAHGDLHLGNLCRWQGRVVPFDALEFDEALATIDLGYDLAFLLMDLDVRASRTAANRVLGRYVGRTGDGGLLGGMPAFLSSRAMIRAHVERRVGHIAEADAYLARALAYLRQPPAVIVAIGGLPGTGKTTLARALAPSLGTAPGALVLRSDEIRKRLCGVTPEQRLPPSGYMPEVSARVFRELATMAQTVAGAGHAVIADATFLSLEHRALIRQAAAGAGVPFVGFWLQAPLAALERRVTERTGDASDATVAVLRAAAPNDPGPGDWAAIDATDAATAEGLAKAHLDTHIALT
jgi:aminoglycoside phosphotransferase family enzyme/predicted kinase